MKAHIVFDFDGTIIDSEDQFLDTLVQILPKYLNKKVSKEEVLNAYLPDWSRLLENLGLGHLSEEEIQLMIDDVNEVSKDYVPTLYDGVLELIEKLRKENYETYLWTGRDKKSSKKILNHYKINELFKEMHFRDTATPKPSADALELMFEGVEKSKVVLIGDSVVDIRGAQNFGISCLAVDWKSKADFSLLMGAGAREIFYKPSELYSWIERELS